MVYRLNITIAELAVIRKTIDKSSYFFANPNTIMDNSPNENVDIWNHTFLLTKQFPRERLVITVRRLTCISYQQKHLNEFEC